MESEFQIISGTDKSCQDKLNEYSKNYKIKVIQMAVAPIFITTRTHHSGYSFNNQTHLVVRLTPKPETSNG